MAHTFDPTILREYDIRGTFGSTLSINDAHLLGEKFASFIQSEGGGTVCVGWDGRLSSPELSEALIEALVQHGINVISVGMGPTPMLYFALKKTQADGAIMVTGSHNPPQDNGFKVALKDRPFFGSDIKALPTLESCQKFQGSVETQDIRQDYITRLLQDFSDQGKSMRVAWDTGNGATGEIVTSLIEHLPGEHFLINADVDGTFPAHAPDPTVPENLIQLTETVLKKDCQLGIAFDGDGDRLGVIDGHGRILLGDQLLALFARDVLEETPGATVIGDVKASQVLFSEIERLGGRPLMSRTGHSLIKSKMLETGAILAGEVSGHFFFADHYYGYDDGIYAAIRLLSFLQSQNQNLAKLFDSLPKMENTPEIRISVEENEKFSLIEKMKTLLKDSGSHFIDIDGVRVESDDGWWLLRASNTSPILVARCESSSTDGLSRLKGTLNGYLEALDLGPVA